MTGGTVTRTAALHEWAPGFQQLVCDTILKPKGRKATVAELALFAEQCIRTGLDPMSKQIYGIYRHDSRAGGQVMSIQVGIDGFRAIAERTGRYAGGPATLFCGPDRAWTDVWDEAEKPIAAKAIVRKVVGGVIVETEAVATWREYGCADNVWKTKPAHMLGKCAEAIALRRAFPHDMSGLYTDDEMQRVIETAPRVPPPAIEATVVEPEDGVPLEDVVSEVVKRELIEERKLLVRLTAAGATTTSTVRDAVASVPAENRGQLASDLADLLAAAEAQEAVPA